MAFAAHIRRFPRGAAGETLRILKRQEGTSITNNLESLDDYLSAMPGGSDPDPVYAARTAKRVIQRIQAENAAVGLDALEDALEQQDRSLSLFYGGDDLTRDQASLLPRPRTEEEYWIECRRD